MKKIKNYFAFLAILILFPGAMVLYAQNPTYRLEVKHDSLRDARTFQFDVYIYKDSASPLDLELNNYELSFLINNINQIRNGGNLTGSYVSGTSDLGTFKPLGLVVIGAKVGPNIRVNGPSPAALAEINVPISGFRVGTFQILNTVDYGQSPMNMIWWNTVPAYTQIWAVVPWDTISAIDISPGDPTVPPYHISYLVNPILNKPVSVFNLSGTGLYCAGGNGLPVTLDGSETGVNYFLKKNGSIVATLAGTGYALSFGNQLKGTYTCTGNRKATYLKSNMNDSAVITEVVPNPVLSTSDIKFDRATLVWTGYCPGVVSYKILVRNVTTPGATTVIVSGSTSSLIKTNLQSGATYWWKISANFGSGWTVYTDSVSFTTLSFSMTVTNITYNRAILHWTGTPGAIKFAIRYKSQGILMPIKYNTTDSAELINLHPNASCTWQINPDYGYGYTVYSPVDTFYTPLPPVLSVSNLNFNQAVLSWAPVSGAVKYAIKCFYGNPLTNPTACYVLFPTPGNTSDTIKGLTQGKLYQWEIRPDYGTGWTSFTPFSSFITPVPTMTVNPLNFNQAKLNWSGINGAVNYAVKYKKGSTWYTATTTSSTYTLTSLTQGTSYSWQVNPDYGAGFTSYTLLKSFITPVPVLTNVSIGSTTASLKWTGITGATSFAVSYTPGTVKFVTTNTISLTGLTPGTTYTWKVNPNYGSTYTTYTSSATFTTNSPRLMNPALFEKEEADNLSIYPNPVKENIFIAFNSASDGKANISLIDITGRIVMNTLFAASKGNNTYSLNTAGIAEGLYMLRLSIGDLLLTRKIVVQR